MPSADHVLASAPGDGHMSDAARDLAARQDADVIWSRIHHGPSYLDGLRHAVLLHPWISLLLIFSALALLNALIGVVVGDALGGLYQKLRGAKTRP